MTTPSDRLWNDPLWNETSSHPPRKATDGSNKAAKEVKPLKECAQCKQMARKGATITFANGQSRWVCRDCSQGAKLCQKVSSKLVGQAAPLRRRVIERRVVFRALFYFCAATHCTWLLCTVSHVCEQRCHRPLCRWKRTLLLQAVCSSDCSCRFFVDSALETHKLSCRDSP